MSDTAGIVLENDATFESDIDPQHCPIGASCVYEHQAGFKRRRSRLVWDDPEEHVRVQLGDVAQPTANFQRANDVLGLAIEKSPRKLAPGESISPTGRGSFSIERPADVEVLVNGAVTQRLRLKPGNYNSAPAPTISSSSSRTIAASAAPSPSAPIPTATCLPPANPNGR